MFETDTNTEIYSYSQVADLTLMHRAEDPDSHCSLDMTIRLKKFGIRLRRYSKLTKNYFIPKASVVYHDYIMNCDFNTDKNVHTKKNIKRPRC